MSAWTLKHLQWVMKQHFEQPAHEAVVADYLHEVKQAGERIQRLESSIDTALVSVPEHMRAVIEVLQGTAWDCEDLGGERGGRSG
jgi:hypothetical protein